MFDSLRRSIRELEGEDFSAMTGDELRRAIVVGLAARARLDAQLMELAGTWDASRVWAEDGAKSAAAALTRECRVPIGESRQLLRLARMLRQMPDTAVALAAGQINLAHVRVLCSLINPRTTERFAHDEPVLVDQACGLEFEDFVTAMKYWLQCADPDGTDERAEAQKARRSFGMSQTFGGMWAGQFLLTAISGSIFHKALAAIERELFEADWAEARARLGERATAYDLRRTSQQRWADALVEMATRAASTPKDAQRPAPLVSVVVGLETFRGRVLELANGVVVAPGEVAEHFDGADLERIVFDGPTRVIEVGRTTRNFIGALRRLIQIRDKHCSGYACRTPAEACQVDHIKPFSKGGETTQDNGECGCGFHNRQKGDSDPPATRQDVRDRIDRLIQDLKRAA